MFKLLFFFGSFATILQGGFGNSAMSYPDDNMQYLTQDTRYQAYPAQETSFQVYPVQETGYQTYPGKQYASSGMQSQSYQSPYAGQNYEMTQVESEEPSESLVSSFFTVIRTGVTVLRDVIKIVVSALEGEDPIRRREVEVLFSDIETILTTLRQQLAETNHFLVNIPILGTVFQLFHKIHSIIMFIPKRLLRIAAGIFESLLNVFHRA